MTTQRFHALRGTCLLVSLLVAQASKAEVSGLDHLDHVAVTNCKAGPEEKPRPSPVGPLCSYVQRLCDVSESGKAIFQGVHIDVDCVPKEDRCPTISECAKARLPDKISDYVKTMNDPNSNSNRNDGAGLEDTDATGTPKKSGM